jgi:cytochrome c oxidase assembly factor CtaG
MAQHMLLVVVAAPLLALSAPLGPVLRGLPAPARRALGRGWARLGWPRRLWRALTHPAAAGALHLGLLWVWHAPGLYQAALTSEWVHGLEHASFLGSALLFWWVLARPGRRAPWLRGPGGTLYVFALALPSGLLGALITFSTVAWYPAYALTTRAWGLSPVEDQQLAGAIMWVPAGVVYLAAGLAVLGAWLARMEAPRQAPGGLT